MNISSLIGLVPFLLGSGRVSETATDIHTLATLGKPFAEAQTKAALLKCISDAAATSDYDHLVAAVVSLVQTTAVVVKEPGGLDAIMNALKGASS